jgi:hypothetical protein
MTLLDKIKLALRITVNAYDADLTALIDAAQLDLGIAGVVIPSALDAIVERAIISYCKLHFSALTDGEWSRLKASYDEQKAQLATATGYTDWLGVG